MLKAEEPRRALALMAARFYGSQPKTIVAVTGTSGKTSVAEFTRQIFAALGRKAASLGTIGIVKPDGAVYGSLTTPDPVTLHETLAQLAGEGVTHLAMEASSHGLDQYRLDGVKLSAAAFTNLGRDHLDYHPTIESLSSGQAAALLRAARARAAGRRQSRQRQGVPTWRPLRASAGSSSSPLAQRGETLRLADLSADGFAQRMQIVHDGRTYEVRLPLVGAYQVSNALVAAGLALAAGEAAASVIARARDAQGRQGPPRHRRRRGTAVSRSSTTRTSPRRLRRRSTAYVRSRAASSSASSAAAAIATGASVR